MGADEKKAEEILRNKEIRGDHDLCMDVDRMQCTPFILIAAALKQARKEGAREVLDGFIKEYDGYECPHYASDCMCNVTIFNMVQKFRRMKAGNK